MFEVSSIQKCQHFEVKISSIIITSKLDPSGTKSAHPVAATEKEFYEVTIKFVIARHSRQIAVIWPASSCWQLKATGVERCLSLN